MRAVSLLVLLACLIACGGPECDGGVGRLCIVNRAEVPLWRDLSEAIMLLGLSRHEVCTMPATSRESVWTPEGTLVVWPDWSFVPAHEYNGVLATGMYEIGQATMHIVYREQIEDTALVHEYIQHAVPHQCLGESDANVHHSDDHARTSDEVQGAITRILQKARQQRGELE